MTATGEGKGRRALAALSDLARRSARPPTPAQLDSGLRAVRSRLDDAQPNGWRAFPRRWVVLSWTVLGILAATSALVALSTMVSRSRGIAASIERGGRSCPLVSCLSRLP